VSARSVILILNHVADRHLHNHHAQIEKACGHDYDVFLLSDRSYPSLSLVRPRAGAKEFRFTLEDLIDLGYPGKRDLRLAAAGQRSIKYGNAELPLLLFFAAHSHYRHYWLVEYDVQFSGSWKHFFSSFDESNADLLGTSLIRYAEFPAWSHWQSLVLSGTNANDQDRLRGFFPLYRISNEALSCLHERYQQYCAGHMEVVMPTVLYQAGLCLEDIGGDGEFVKPSNINRFYSNRRLTNELSPGTFVYRPVHRAVGDEPNKLWHPIKPRPNIVIRAANRFLREMSRLTTPGPPAARR
jgi:hypothetical protein